MTASALLWPTMQMQQANDGGAHMQWCSIMPFCPVGLVDCTVSLKLLLLFSMILLQQNFFSQQHGTK